MSRGKIVQPKTLSDDLKTRKLTDDLEKLLTRSVASIRDQAQRLNYPKYVEEMLVDVLPLHLEHLHKQMHTGADPVNTLLGGHILAMNILRETITMCADPTTTKAALKAALEFIEDTAVFANAKGPDINQ